MLLAVVIAYAQVADFSFLELDDTGYVVRNPRAHAGLTLDNVVWAFTTFHAGNWHPLTWLSHMLDCQLFGLNPRGHHIVNLLLHLVNTVLLFAVFGRLTGAWGKSAFVAALFALHPLNVESVAWVAERKNVLSTLFWLTATLAHARWVERPTSRRRWALIALFALGLLTKPMLVSLPLALLALDWWPLRRDEARGGRMVAVGWRGLVAEKAPLLALAAVVAVVTVAAQGAGGAIRSLEARPLPMRLANAVVGYASYLAAAVWPSRLVAIYPYEAALPIWRVGLAVILLAGLSVLAWRLRRARRYVISGWCWYLVTLTPVIGLVQVGVQSRADRYAYVPLIGIFAAVTWGASDLVGRLSGARAARLALTGAGALIVALLGVATARQAAYWRDGVTLFGRTVALTGENPLARNNLGVALCNRGRFAESLPHFDETIRSWPRFAEAPINKGGALLRLGRSGEAVVVLSDAVRLAPGRPESHQNLGAALEAVGRYDEAAREFREALRLAPDFGPAREAAGALRAGRLAEAERAVRAVLQEDPRNRAALALLERIATARSAR